MICFICTDLPKPVCQNCPSVEENPTIKYILDAFCTYDFGKLKRSLISCGLFSFAALLPHDFQNQVIHVCLFCTAVVAKIHRRRLLLGEPEFDIEGRVEFLRQGPLLPYDTQDLLQQWLLINIRCAETLVRPGRFQLYVLIGSVQPDGTLALTRLFPWHKRDVNMVVAARKWKHHKCWMDWTACRD